MRDRYADWLDPEILFVLPRVVPPFPPGSKVTLADGRRAVVTAVEPDQPYRPVVRPLAADGQSMESESIRLKTCPELSIREIAGTPVGDEVDLAAAASAA
jgi:hypothetical protein